MCTVNFYYSGDRNYKYLMKSETVEADTEIQKPTDPTNYDYVFLGWWKGTGDNIPYTKATFPCKITEDTSFYAEWGKNSPIQTKGVLSYDLNTSDNTASVSGVESGEENVETLVIPEFYYPTNDDKVYRVIRLLFTPKI